MKSKSINSFEETAFVSVVGETLYINEAKSKFLPKYVYYLCQSFNCTGACFRNSSHIYKLKDLKEMEEWNNVKSQTKRARQTKLQDK